MASEDMVIATNQKKVGDLNKFDFIPILLGSTTVIFIASFILSGFPNGLLPNLNVPYSFNGDGLFTLWVIKRISEGWVWENIRAGYPFGSDFYDFPGSDLGNFLIIKIISFFFSSPEAIFNIFYLLSFALVFNASYCVLRKLGLGWMLALAASISYSIATFHFKRLDHLFYASYFVAPLFFYFAYRSYLADRFSDLFGSTTIHVVYTIFILFFISSFGVYYALFGVFIFSFIFITKIIEDGQIKKLVPPFVALSIVVGSVLINISPTLMYHSQAGKNGEVAQRSFVESDIYGFKPVQLIIPSLDHRIGRFAQVASTYAASVPNVNENHTSSLGFLGAVGLFLSLLVLMLKLYDKNIDKKFIIFSSLVVLLIAFGASGGLGSVFAWVISPSIRAWNRVSIFILFACLFVLFGTINWLITRRKTKYGNAVLYIIAPLTIFIAVFDQTPYGCIACNPEVHDQFKAEKKFFQKLETLVPEGAPLYQIPYIPFPESPYKNGQSPYRLLVPFSLTKGIKWSAGGIKGRSGDLFYRALSNEAISKQVSVIQKLGFFGVLVDGRFYEDQGHGILIKLDSEKRLELIDSDPGLGLYFYRFVTVNSVKTLSKDPYDIMSSVGYVADRDGIRIDGSFRDGINFSSNKLPSNVKKITGLSGLEPWGRWSDANLGSSVKIEFFNSLPERFRLIFTARAFGEHGEQIVFVKIGGVRREVKINSESSIISMDFENLPSGIHVIEFIPMNPRSPRSLNINSEARMLGLGLTDLKVLRF